MRLPRPLRSGAFRFALILALVFGAGAVTLLVVVRDTIQNYTADAAEDAVSTESDILRVEDRELGRAELVRAIARHERATPERQLRYLLVAPGGSRLAGTLPTGLAMPGWREARIAGDPPRGGEAVPLLARGIRLDDGAVLVVASDTSDLSELRADLLGHTVVFGMVIGALALVGGLIVGGVFLRRLDRVNLAIDRIVAGRFAERLPRIGMGAEFDELSARLNVMLDRIQQLVDGLRQVSVDIAHDLRTPLSRIRQRLERMEATLPSEQGEEVERTIDALDEVLDIFAALLKIGTLESGTARASQTTVDLALLAEHIVDAYRPEVEDGGRRLLTSIVPDVRVQGDRELLGQALANLVGNAIVHTPEGTTISVATLQVGGRALLIVADDGPGVPDDQRDHVLRRFYRLDRSRSTPGAGLGLSLAASVAAIHGGSLVLDDAAPGLRATLDLPASRERAASRSSTSTSRVIASGDRE